MYKKDVKNIVDEHDFFLIFLNLKFLILIL